MVLSSESRGQLDWRLSLAFVRKREGGYSDHPLDTGGPTYAGITAKAAVGIDLNGDGLPDFDLDHDGDVDAADLLELKRREEAGDSTAPALIEAFYRARYWLKARCDAMAWPWCLYTFDAAVNHGPAAAVLMLQRSIGAAADGVPGFRTLAGVQAGTEQQLRLFLRNRAELYALLTVRDVIRLARQRGVTPEAQVKAQGIKGTFFAGWAMRLLELEAEARKGEKAER